MSFHWTCIILPVGHLHTLEEERKFRQQEHRQPDAPKSKEERKIRQQEHRQPDAPKSNSCHDIPENVSLHFDLVTGSKHVTDLPLYLNNTTGLLVSWQAAGHRRRCK